MGETNTPPVSPRDTGSNESDEEGIGTTQADDDDYEVIEVYEEVDLENENDEEDGAGGEGLEDEEDMAEVPDDAVITFKQHTGEHNDVHFLKITFYIDFYFRLGILLFI